MYSPTFFQYDRSQINSTLEPERSVNRYILSFFIFFVASNLNGMKQTEDQKKDLELPALTALCLNFFYTFFDKPHSYLRHFDSEKAFLDYWEKIAELNLKNVNNGIEEVFYKNFNNLSHFSLSNNRLNRISPDGNYWASTTGLKLAILAFPTMEPLVEIGLKRLLTELIWNSDNTHLITSPSQYFENNADIWNIRDGSLVQTLHDVTFGQVYMQNLINFSDKGRFIIFCTSKSDVPNNLRIVNLQRKNVRQANQPQGASLQHVIDDPPIILLREFYYQNPIFPSQRIVGWSIDREKRAFALEDVKVWTLSPAKNILAVVKEQDSSIYIHKTEDGTLLNTISLDFEPHKYTLFFNSNEEKIWAGDERSHTVKCYDLTTQRLLKKIQLPHQYLISVTPNERYFIGHHHDGLYLLDSDAENQSFKKIIEKDFHGSPSTQVFQSLSLITICTNTANFGVFSLFNENGSRTSYPLPKRYQGYHPTFQINGDFLIISDNSWEKQLFFLKPAQYPSTVLLGHLFLKKKFDEFLEIKKNPTNQQTWSERLNEFPMLKEHLKTLPDEFSYLRPKPEVPLIKVSAPDQPLS